MRSRPFFSCDKSKTGDCSVWVEIRWHRAVPRPVRRQLSPCQPATLESGTIDALAPEHAGRRILMKNAGARPAARFVAVNGAGCFARSACGCPNHSDAHCRWASTGVSDAIHDWPPHRGPFVARRGIRGRFPAAPRRPGHLAGGITARRSLAMGNADDIHLSVRRSGAAVRAHWRLSQPRVRYQRRNRMRARSFRRTVLLPGRQFPR